MQVVLWALAVREPAETWALAAGSVARGAPLAPPARAVSRARLESARAVLTALAAREPAETWAQAAL